MAIQKNKSDNNFKATSALFLVLGAILAVLVSILLEQSKISHNLEKLVP